MWKEWPQTWRLVMLKNKNEKEEKIRKNNIKTENLMESAIVTIRKGI